MVNFFLLSYYIFYFPHYFYSCFICSKVINERNIIILDTFKISVYSFKITCIFLYFKKHGNGIDGPLYHI